MGSYYAYNFSRMTEADIVICCDPSPKKLASFQEKWNIARGTTQWEDLLDTDQFQLDGIINCSIDTLHEAVFTRCLKANFPLFQEKPPAVDLKRISGHTNGRITHWPFIINFSKRWLPAVQDALVRIAKGEIGRIHKLELHYRQGWLQNHDFGDWHTNSAWCWRLSNNLSHHGVIGDLASHLFDLAVLFGGNVSDISCQTTVLSKEPPSLDGEALDSADEAICAIRHENAVFTLIHASRAVPGETDNLELRISGSRGTIEISSVDNYERLRRFQVGVGAWEVLPCERLGMRNHRIFVDMLVNGTDPDGLPDCTPRLRDAVYNEILITAAVMSARDECVTLIADLVKDYGLEAWL